MPSVHETTLARGLLLVGPWLRDSPAGQSGVKEALDDAARIGDGLLKGL
jgi:hypothetical protein